MSDPTHRAKAIRMTAQALDRATKALLRAAHRPQSDADITVAYLGLRRATRILADHLTATGALAPEEPAEEPLDRLRAMLAAMPAEGVA